MLCDLVMMLGRRNTLNASLCFLLKYPIHPPSAVKQHGAVEALARPMSLLSVPRARNMPLLAFVMPFCESEMVSREVRSLMRAHQILLDPYFGSDEP